MTKKKRPPGSGGAVAYRGHVLIDEAKRSLAIHAGYDLSNPQDEDYLQKYFMQIEIVLGQYHSVKALLDNPQTPAEFVKDADRFRKLAISLLTELRQSTEWTRSELQGSGLEVSDFEEQIASFLDALREMERRYEVQKKRGNTTNAAIRTVIDGVTAVFQRICVGVSSERIAQGAVIKRSAREIAEMAFVEIALRDAKIPVPTRLDRYIHEPWH